MSKIPFQIGDVQIHAVVTEYQRPVPTMLNVHEDETTSVAAGKANLSKHGGRLIELTHSGQRLVSFGLNGKQYAFDPNRIFSDIGITETLKKHSSYSAEAHAEIKNFAQAYLREFALDREPVIIALHNTVDGIFSIKSFLPSGHLGDNAAAVNVSANRSRFDFFYVTEQKFFDFLRARDFNVVLQDNSRVTEDGSLSVHFARKGIPYVNVEAEMNHLDAQLEMLEGIREMLELNRSR